MSKLFVAHQRVYNVSEMLKQHHLLFVIILLVNSIKQTTCIKQACHHFPQKGKCTVIYLHYTSTCLQQANFSYKQLKACLLHVGLFALLSSFMMFVICDVSCFPSSGCRGCWWPARLRYRLVKFFMFLKWNKKI